ncbi:MAG TPA: 2Fe-2S iron-sulfur cluster-binding protein [Bacillota bacterium]|jgi:NADH dehydrogenase/NADH:ubiquinone oxidoreductase subunit G|nr:2Fe-2S iron-sulfur cluster-binding protein [Bacillota bacterium]HPZ41874.1 2Fe-2S iron-sulfur cluster-binding protein [Bacillota bacterium]HQD52757.1 2Fe-2S iron-sulfur cluster-binding protein [Bacillota bacterium]
MMIEVKINGKPAEVPAGTTILAAARSCGVNIPTLCHHEALEPFGACRLCLVAIDDAGRQSIVAACNYPLEHSGLVVETDTSAVWQARKMSLKLLLARCPGVKVLQDLAREWAVDTKDLLLTEDRGEECILCGRCVRVCREVIGKSAISFAFRGVERRVSAPFDQEPDACLGCTACAFVCPTGAVKVIEQNGRRLIAPWHSNLEQVACKECGRAVAPVKMLAHLRGLAGEENEQAGEGVFCSRCRRLKTAAAVTALPEVKFPGPFMIP